MMKMLQTLLSFKSPKLLPETIIYVPEYMDCYLVKHDGNKKQLNQGINFKWPWQQFECIEKRDTIIQYNINKSYTQKAHIRLSGTTYQPYLIDQSLTGHHSKLKDIHASFVQKYKEFQFDQLEIIITPGSHLNEITKEEIHSKIKKNIEKLIAELTNNSHQKKVEHYIDTKYNTKSLSLTSEEIKEFTYIYNAEQLINYSITKQRPEYIASISHILFNY